MKRIFALALACLLLLTGCGGDTAPRQDTTDTLQETTQPTATPTASGGKGEMFSDRDFDPTYDESKSAVITLSGTTASCSSNAVQISGSTVTITDEGTYILRGTLTNGMIIVSGDKSDKTQIVLDGADIHSETCAAIYVKQADKVFITLGAGTENALSNGGSYVAIDDSNIDAVIFSRDDLTLNGSGSLTVTAPAGHGIVCKDELAITGGSYGISAASHGLNVNDGICLSGASMTITSGKDGMHGENDEESSLGYIYVDSGSYVIDAQGDGLDAGAYLTIADGSFTITAGGGSENAASQSSDSWGNFMGGGMGGHGGMGGMGGPGDLGRGGYTDTTSSTTSDDDSTSIKGIKAAGDLTIHSGSYVIDSADDAIHSNSNVTIHGGAFTIATGDDGFHADETLTITDGTIAISESYEGLEGLHVLVSGGNVTLTADDDGINAAGGTDASGYGGMRGGDMFGGSSGGSISISGGNLHITAYGDGLDANGTLEISGGYTVVCGPTGGDTATLDYDMSAVISGGTFIGTGASTMAQSISGSGQGVIAVTTGSQSGGSTITVVDGSGNTLLTYTPDLNYAVFIYSSPELVSGASYQLTCGTASGTVTAN